MHGNLPDWAAPSYQKISSLPQRIQLRPPRTHNLQAKSAVESDSGDKWSQSVVFEGDWDFGRRLQVALTFLDEATWGALLVLTSLRRGCHNGASPICPLCRTPDARTECPSSWYQILVANTLANENLAEHRRRSDIYSDYPSFAGRRVWSCSKYRERKCQQYLISSTLYEHNFHKNHT